MNVSILEEMVSAKEKEVLDAVGTDKEVQHIWVYDAIMDAMMDDEWVEVSALALIKAGLVDVDVD